jgi:hypothetical protein
MEKRDRVGMRTNVDNVVEEENVVATIWETSKRKDREKTVW